YPRDDSRETVDLRDQEGRARRGHAVPPRIGRRARDARHHDAARNQQGHVRRMSLLSSLRKAPPPAIAVEIAATHVSGAVLDRRGGRPVVAAHASEPLAPGALVASLTAANVHDRPAVAGAL